MSIVLASTWRPRGEGPRLQRLRQRLEAVYERIVVALPPGAYKVTARASHAQL